MAQYRFTGEQRHVFCDLQADDGSTLVVEPGQVVNVVNLHESLKGWFESVGSKPAKKASAKKQAAPVRATVTDTPPAPDPGAETPPTPDATEGKE